MLADAETPGRIELLVSVNCAVTANVATPELTVAAGAINVILPSRACVEPAGVTCAPCPTATRFTCESLTVPVTWYEPGAKTMNALVAEPLDTDWPALTFTWDTIPAIGEVSVAP